MDRSVCLQMTKAQIMASEAYKAIPAGYNKSKLNKGPLCDLLHQLLSPQILPPAPIQQLQRPLSPIKPVQQRLPVAHRLPFITSSSVVAKYPLTTKCHADWDKVIPFLFLQIEENKLPACIPQSEYGTLPRIVITLNPMTLEVDKAEVPPTLYDNILNCKEPWVIVYISIYGWVNEETGKPTETGHANILLINKERQEMERFEPHGHETYIYSAESMNAYFANLAALFGYKYISPLDYCPRGPQSREAADAEIRRMCQSLGYCVAWSTMYALMRLLNPEYSRDEVLADIMKGTPQELHMKARRFTAFMESVLPD
jgi:hypothetical protein